MNQFTTIANRHEWAPGAREMAEGDYLIDKRARAIIDMMAAELALPKNWQKVVKVRRTFLARQELEYQRELKRALTAY